uniref:hypothetical protein n=1 Tax=Clostridium sp. NkU-1 TaxID=1095009 RepID=UPI003261B853
MEKKVFEAGKDLKIITDIKGNLLDLRQFNTHADIKNLKTFFTIQIKIVRAISPPNDLSMEKWLCYYQ